MKEEQWKRHTLEQNEADEGDQTRVVRKETTLVFQPTPSEVQEIR